MQSLDTRVGILEGSYKTIIEILNARDEAEANKERKCIVQGCTNTSTQGKFIGDLCESCHTMLISGRPEMPSDNFIHKMYLWHQKVAGLMEEATCALKVLRNLKN